MSSSDIAPHPTSSHRRESPGATDPTAIRTQQIANSLMDDVYIEEIDASHYGSPSIASGSFGEVSIAIYRLSRGDHGDGVASWTWGWSYAAIKKIRNAVLVCNGEAKNLSGGFDIGGLELTKEASTELAALRALGRGHPCIVPLLTVYLSQMGLGEETSVSLAFPYCLMDLSSAIELKHLNGEVISDSVVKAVIRDVLSGLEFCHKKEVIHGDVNPANVMISSHGRAQLTDFGIAYLSGGKQIPSPTLCTINYRAPEVMMGEMTPHPSLDIWAAGLILCELLTLHTTFTGRSNSVELNHIFDVLGIPSETNWPEAEKLPELRKMHFDLREPKGLVNIIPRAGLCPELADLLQATVSLDPASRCSAAACLGMPWFSSKPIAADSPKVLESLVPEELMVSPSFSPKYKDGKIDLDEEKERAVSLAASRRAAARRAWGEEEGEWWLGPSLLKEE